MVISTKLYQRFHSVSKTNESFVARANHLTDDNSISLSYSTEKMVTWRPVKHSLLKL